MPHIETDDQVKLYVEEAGAGTPVLFIHEFAGDHRSWAPQMEYFSDSYRCVTYGARGFSPSDVPEDPNAYSQNRAVADAIAVLDALEIERAHIVGLSMGGFCALHLGLQHPDRALSLLVGGCGYGADPDAQEGFRGECDAIASSFEQLGSTKVAETYSVGPARVQFQNKNPDGWQVFATQLGEHSAAGSAYTMRGVQGQRPSLYALRDELAALSVPTLIAAGDEDDGCLETDLMLKRTIPTAGLAILPKSGHTLNLEEPRVFNRMVEEFLGQVEAGTWQPRDPRSQVGSITGVTSVEDS